VDTTKAITPGDQSGIPTAVCFCAGYGGLERGLERVLGKIRVLAFSEIEAYPVANLMSKMESGAMEAAPVWTNLKTFPGEMFRDKVDFLTGGFPCQPFSSAGRRGGDEDPRHLFPYFIRAIRAIRPRRVFLENVTGIISATIKSDGWADPIGTPVLQHVCRELEREGYRVETGVFSAEEVGAPHQRKRVFILAEKKELADTFSAGLERTYKARQENVFIREDSELRDDPSGCSSELASQWPSRPGEKQRGWEPPRAYRADKVATKSDMGGDTNGTAGELDATLRRMENRADRLKLCGNGVVSQTAERAYRVLSGKLRGAQNA